MARHDSGNHEDDDRVRRDLQRELHHERAEERRVSRALGFADFMAVLMVLATGFSAYAAWRTEQVTRLVFATADRPFVEVARLQFEAKDSPNPYIAVDYRNFGKIPAVDGLISVRAWVDGRDAP